jgi:membrane associated rhomboid family serine protease
MTTPVSSTDAGGIDPLEDILRRCAAAAPSPWYPRQYAKRAGIPLAELAVDVEFLWLEGYLRPASQAGDPVSGLTLSEAGVHLLANPEGLAALREGRHGTRARDRAARSALRAVGSPVVSRALLVVNLLVFAGGVWIAMGIGSARAFLAGSATPGVLEVLHRTGSISADDIAAGQWWRLMTAAFVHGGVLHLLMNMSVLAFSFGLAEAMWGRSRYLLIYLVAAFGGNCLAMAWQPAVELSGPGGGRVEVSQPVVGASGALCGVLAATMVWVVFNGRHLPRATATQLRTSLISSAVLLIFISLFRNVSGLCHLGGALFGAASAALLDLHRWRTGPLRWLALAGLVALPWLGMRAIDRARATDPRWHRVERRVFDHLYKQRVATVGGEAEDLFRRHIAPVLHQSPRKRDEGQVRRALADATENHPILVELAAELARAGPYRDADTERDREAELDRVEKLAAKFAEAEDLLKRNANTPEKDEVERTTFSRQFLNRIHETMNRAITLSQGEVKDLLRTPPRDRDRDVSVIAATALKGLTRELKDLTDALGEAGPYGNEEVEHARSTAERYAAARLAQVKELARCLRAGGKWTPEDEATLQKRSEEVAALRSEWERLIEKEEQR